MGKQLSFTLGTVLVVAWAGTAGAVTYNVGPSDDWYGTISGSALLPGDEVVLADGTYSLPSPLYVGHQGTAANPIVIRAADGANPIINGTAAAVNRNIYVMGGRHLIFRGLEVTGGGGGFTMYANGSGQHSKFVTIEDCHIHHVGGGGIRCNQAGQTYEGMIFRGNEIDHIGGHGEGFYLGGNNDASGNTTCWFYNGLIEYNYIHHTQGDQGDGIEIKDGSYNNIIRDNVIYSPNFPGIIVYGTDGQADKPNIIERNVIWSGGDNGIQAAAEAIVRNNIVYMTSPPGGWRGIKSQVHQSAEPGNLEIVHNTVICQNGRSAIRVNDPPGGATGPIIIANNALYANGPEPVLDIRPTGAVLSGNVVSTNLAADFGDVANLDFFPIPGSALIGAGDPACAIDDDFNGTPRSGTVDAGAYKYNLNGNPGWAIVAGFKPIPEPGAQTLLALGGLALIRRRG